MNKYFIIICVTMLLVKSNEAQVTLASLEKGEIYISHQNIDITASPVTLKDGEVNTKKTLMLSGNDLRLENVTLSGQKIFLRNTLKNLKINGAVVFDADEIEIESPLTDAAGKPIPFTLYGTGTITFLYKTLNTANGVPFRSVSYTPAQGQNVSIEFKKKN